MVLLKIAPMNPYAHIPKQQSIGASGFDLASCEETFVMPGKTKVVSTGLMVEIPKGHEGQVRPRSGLAAKHGITVLNAPGTIDSDYRGEVKVILINHSDEHFKIRIGDRIAQLIIVPIATPRMQIVTPESLSKTARSTGGLGSTG